MTFSNACVGPSSAGEGSKGPRLYDWAYVPHGTAEPGWRKGLLIRRPIDRSDCRVTVESFAGLMVEYAAERNANAIVRGIRAISDYEYELQMALMNRRLQPRLETVFMMPAEEYSYVSSRLVKEVFHLGAPIKDLVPPLVEDRMREKSFK